MLSQHQKDFLAAFPDFTVRGESALQNFHRLANLKDWERDSGIYLSFWRAFFPDGQRLEESEPDLSSGVGTHVVLTPESSDDGVRLESSEDEEAVLEGAFARLELTRPLAVTKDSKPTREVTHPTPYVHDPPAPGANDSSAGITNPRKPSESILKIYHPILRSADDESPVRYFHRFFTFTPDDAAPIRDEFRRLAKQMGWTRESTKYVQEQHAAFASELQYCVYGRYGRAATLSRVQSFCKDVGIDPVPASMTQCKKVLSNTHINIFDYIDCCRKGVPIKPIFYTKSSFKRYTKGSKVFPKAAVKGEDPSFGFLLSKVFS